MKKIWIAILMFWNLDPVFSCGNEYGHTLDGMLMETRYFFLPERMFRFDEQRVKERLEELSSELGGSESGFKVWSDIAANLMKIGQADSSIKILRPLLEQHPDEYNIIANLGTSYELVGELDSALKYISKGYALNPNSHRGSEWMHVKILEAKIKDKGNPGWLEINEIVNLEKLLERVNERSLRSEVTKINRDFFYQIRTRAPFTPAPNQVLANLLATLGDFNAHVGTYENALLAYTYAMKFQYNPYMVDKVKKKIKALNRKRDAQPQIRELPTVFIRMMKRSKLEPEILLMGLDDYANQLDSIHLAELARNDTLALMRQQLDSIKTASMNGIQYKEGQLSAAEDKKYIFLSIGLALGIGLSFLIFKLTRR